MRAIQLNVVILQLAKNFGTDVAAVILYGSILCCVAFAGVHCTHGFNRTGYLIVSYLVEKMEWRLVC